MSGYAANGYENVLDRSVDSGTRERNRQEIEELTQKVEDLKTNFFKPEDEYLNRLNQGNDYLADFNRPDDYLADLPDFNRPASQSPVDFETFPYADPSRFDFAYNPQTFDSMVSPPVLSQDQQYVNTNGYVHSPQQWQAEASSSYHGPMPPPLNPAYGAYPPQPYIEHPYAATSYVDHPSALPSYVDHFSAATSHVEHSVASDDPLPSQDPQVVDAYAQLNAPMESHQKPKPNNRSNPPKRHSDDHRRGAKPGKSTYEVPPRMRNKVSYLASNNQLFGNGNGNAQIPKDRPKSTRAATSEEYNYRTIYVDPMWSQPAHVPPEKEPPKYVDPKWSQPAHVPPEKEPPRQRSPLLETPPIVVDGWNDPPNKPPDVASSVFNTPATDAFGAPKPIVTAPRGWDDCTDTPSSSRKQKKDSWTLKFFEDATKAKFGDKTYIDTHCHYDFIFDKAHWNGTVEEYEVKNERTWSKAYEGCIPDYCEPGAILREDGQGWDKVVKDQKVKGIAFGCHPHWSDHFNDELQYAIRARLLHEKVVAVGECGYDFSYKNSVPVDTQTVAFETQVEWAREMDKPLLIHCRGNDRDNLQRGDAETLCLDGVKKILRSTHPIHRHCFTLGMQEANRWLNEFPNLYIGLTPLVVRPAGYRERVMEVVKECPLDKIVIETDAPYFLPFMHKGKAKFSHPGVGMTVPLKIAEERNLPVETVLEQIRENTRKLYGV